MTAHSATRALGDGLVVSSPGLGCMGMSDFYGHSDEAESMAVLDRAVDLGTTFWDSSDMYGRGSNEALLSRWFVTRNRRDEITLATKFGIVRGPDAMPVHTVCGRPDYVKAACHYSLARLGVDHIDLYYQHRVDPEVPIEDTVGAMAELVAEGKVRHLGLSEAGPDTIRRAHAVHPIAALESEWSIWTRDIEATGSVAACRELGIGLVAYSPLGRGFLTGKLVQEDLSPIDFRRRAPRFVGDAMENNRHLIDTVVAVARRRGVEPAQLALAWLLAQGEDVVPIPGTRRVAYLEQNSAANDIVLTEDELAELEHIGGRVKGDRYPDMSLIGR